MTARRSRTVAAPLAGAILVLAAALGFVGRASAEPNPLACSGYTEPRAFLESQGWWSPMPTTGGVGHVHVATCFPHGRQLRGVVDFDVRVMLHENPGRANLLRLAIGSRAVAKQKIEMSCAHDCTQWFRISYDTATWPTDGRQELRFTVKVKQPDGKTQYQSTGWQAYFANGKPVRNYRSSDVTIARGWYTGMGYTNASLESAFPWSPVTGVWRPSVRFSPGSGAGEFLATVDPNFHAGVPGLVVAQGAGGGTKRLEIDTSRLAPGPHKLVLIASARRAIGTNSGVQVVPFTVAR